MKRRRVRGQFLGDKSGAIIRTISVLLRFAYLTLSCVNRGPLGGLGGAKRETSVPSWVVLLLFAAGLPWRPMTRFAKNSRRTDGRPPSSSAQETARCCWPRYSASRKGLDAGQRFIKSEGTAGESEIAVAANWK